MVSDTPKFLLFVAVAVTLWVAVSLAVAADDGAPSLSFTADEQFFDSKRRFNEGDYAGAVAAIEKFKRDFGASEQAKDAVAQLRFPLAVSLLQLKKFPEAGVVIEETLKTPPALSPDQREELAFWRGVCLMQEENYDAARKAFTAFGNEFPSSKKRAEAQILFGTSLITERKFSEAAEHLLSIQARLDPADRGRVAVLRLYSLLEAGDNDKALALVVEEFPRMDDMLQIATFQTLALQLGSNFLEQGRLRDAIQCLHRVWSRDRLVKHQQARLERYEDMLKAAEAQPTTDSYRKFQLKQMITKVRRELENFEKIENFDAALRLRLATAFLMMQRYREAALILEEMLAKMPPDGIVEQASITLIQAWTQIERWDRVVAAATLFEEKFPKSEQLSLALYLAGVAEQQANDQPAAIALFDRIIKQFPKSDFAARAFFMRGFSELLAERNADAVKTFDAFAKAHPDHELVEAAAYWRGMGFSLDKQFEESRSAMDLYLAKYPSGNFAGLATFRKAYGAHSMMDYAQSIEEMTAYLEKFPGHESNDEALLLLGDAYLDGGDTDAGLAAYQRISPANTRFFEEAWFKSGQVYRLLEDNEALRAHFEQFREEHPRSPRVAEAVYWIGWTHRQGENPDLARAVYWEAISDLGNDPTIRSVEDLFPALTKLYRGDEEQRQYLTRLTDLHEQAVSDGQSTLAMRALWAQARALARTDGGRARDLLFEASQIVDIPNTNPLILADMAQAMLETGRIREAESFWKDLIKWNPRASQKDRAFAALMQIEIDRGKERAALDWIDRFERETSGSVLAGPVALAKGRLLVERGDFDGARTALESVLTAPGATGNLKAEALFLIGDSYMTQKKPELAVPYFQRVYIMHGRWSDWVARAYFRSGEAFEALQNKEAARKTYDEMTRVDAIQSLPETQKGRERLEALGGPVSES